VGGLVCTHTLRANVLTLSHLNVQIGFFQPTILRLPRHRAEKARTNLAQSCYRDREGSCRKGLAQAASLPRACSYPSQPNHSCMAMRAIQWSIRCFPRRTAVATDGRQSHERK
jgi:hypothetical protein